MRVHVHMQVHSACVLACVCLSRVCVSACLRACVLVCLCAHGFHADAGHVQVWAYDEWECRQHCQHGSCAQLPAGSARRSARGAGGEVCVCEADWIGRNCDMHSMMTWRFLPLEAQLMSAAGGGGRSRGHHGHAGGAWEGEGGGDVAEDASNFWDEALFQVALPRISAPESLSLSLARARARARARALSLSLSLSLSQSILRKCPVCVMHTHMSHM